MGVDFTGKIEQVTSVYDVPYSFYRKGIFTMPDVASYLNRFGPMYIIELYGRKFIYQDRGRYESFISEDGIVYDTRTAIECLTPAEIASFKINNFKSAEDLEDKIQLTDLFIEPDVEDFSIISFK